MTVTHIIIIAVAIILSLVSLAGGIFCIVRYVKTKKIALLIVGLLLTFILPGICLCLVLVSFIPSPMIVYGPPPSITP
jgi:hypothetical protein